MRSFHLPCDAPGLHMWRTRNVLRPEIAAPNKQQMGSVRELTRADASLRASGYRSAHAHPVIRQPPGCLCSDAVNMLGGEALRPFLTTAALPLVRREVIDHGCIVGASRDG